MAERERGFPIFDDGTEGFCTDMTADEWIILQRNWVHELDDVLDATRVKDD